MFRSLTAAKVTMNDDIETDCQWFVCLFCSRFQKDTFLNLSKYMDVGNWDTACIFLEYILKLLVKDGRTIHLEGPKQCSQGYNVLMWPVS